MRARGSGRGEAVDQQPPVRIPVSPGRIRELGEVAVSLDHVLVLCTLDAVQGVVVPGKREEKGGAVVGRR
jgi:hypothetical protein